MEIREIKIFLASSDELHAERDAVHKLKDEVGKEFSQLKLEIVKWETDLPGGSFGGKRIQDAINPLLEECEIVFVLFYSKAGDFTIEELRLAEAKGKKIFVYFKTGFTTRVPAENAAFGKALELCEQIKAENRILFGEYADDRGFEKIFKENLQKQLRLLVKPTPPDPTVTTSSITPPLPPNEDNYFAWFDDLALLKPADVFNKPRARTVIPELYYRRPHDNDADACLRSNQNLMLLGNPLAGKTRTFYEAVGKLNDTRLIVPKLRKFPADISLPLASGKRSLFIFNDINDFLHFGAEHLVLLLQRLAEQDALIAATCRTGSEFLAFRSAVPQRVFEFIEVRIPRLSRDEEREFLQTASLYQTALDQQAFLDSFDRNLGSFFLGLTEMKQRYDSLQTQIVPLYQREHAYQGPERLPSDILLGLAYHYFAGSQHEKSAYEVAYIRDFCTRKFKYDHAEAGDNPFAAAFAKVQKNSFSNRDFDDALSMLGEADKTQLSFLQTDGEYILIEEVYLEKVIHLTGDLGSVLRDLKKYYTETELRQRFLANVFQFSKFVRQARNLDQGLRIIQSMSQMGILPNTVTFTSLIPLCKELEQGFEILERMEAAKVERNTVTFTSLIPLCKELEQGFEILERMEAAKVEPDTVTFTSLIPLCKELEQGFEILERMEAAKVERNTVTFTSLIPLCKELEQGFEILERMEAAKVEPDTVTFTSLIPLCKELEQGFEILERMEAAKVERNTVTFNSLIPLCKELEQGFEILERMEAAKVERNTVTFTSLIPLCKELEQGFEILERMEAAKVERNTVTFNSLIPLCKELEQGFEILERMEAAKVEPDTVTFTSLIPLCKELEQGFEILERMEAAKVERNTVTFTSLIPLCKELEQGFEILERMEAAKVERNTVTFTSLIPLCKELEQGFEILERMEAAKVERNTVTFTSLIPLCKELEQGFEILERMEAAKVERNTVTFTSLFSLANNVEEGISILEKAKGIFTHLKPHYLFKLLKLKPTLEDLALIDKVRVEWEVEVDETYLNKFKSLQSKLVGKA